MDDTQSNFDHLRHTYGYLLTYVDDFLMVGPLHVRNAIEEEVSRIWKIRVEGHVNQFDRRNPDASITFLSTIIRSHPKQGGYYESRRIRKGCIEDLGNDEL